VTRAHPLLNVDAPGCHFDLLNIFRLRTALHPVLTQVRFEVFEKGHFLLQLLGVITEAIPGLHVLLFGLADCSPLVVVENHVVLRDNDLSAVIEENTCCVV